MLKETTSAGAQLSAVVKPRYLWQRASVALQYAIFPVAVLLLWQICSEIGFVRRNVFPPPSTVLLVWYDLVAGATDAAAPYLRTWVRPSWGRLLRGVFVLFLGVWCA